VHYFGTEEEPECHMCFHFPVMPRIFYSIRDQRANQIVEILADTPPIPKGAQWSTFLRNHDELTLEMVSTEERASMYGWYAPDSRMRANVGIRRRLAPLLDNSRPEIQLIHALVLSLPGSPCLYYGDEIGMGDNIWLDDRDAVRRRHAVVTSTPELQERERVKLATLTAALADALRGRGVPEPTATLAAESGVTVFRLAFDAWATRADPPPLTVLADELFTALRGVAAPG